MSVCMHVSLYVCFVLGLWECVCVCIVVCVCMRVYISLGWVCPHHHGLPGGEVGQQHVVLHDVAGHLPEGPQLSGPPVHQDLPLHARLSVGKRRKVSVNATPLGTPAPVSDLHPAPCLTCSQPGCSSEWTSQTVP